ncbi:MAG: TIGR04141 family sporadically distributed protein [Tepidisphaeraceae bacterium]
MALPSLGAKCSELLTEYANDAYKTKGFEFIDYLHCERDPVRIDELNAKLITTLESGTFDGVHLAPPEPIDDQEVDCFTFAPSQDAEEYQQLEVGKLLEALGGQPVTWNGLKAIRVCIRHPNTTVPIAKWPATQCLVYELQDGDDRFVLTCGDWYRIHKKFVDKVGAKVSALSTAATLSLPPAKTSHDEGAYNASVEKLPGFILMDKKCSRAFGDAIEACDLFTTKKQFVHVKRKTRSATLSHLFSQGVISADSFMDEEAYRVDVKKLVDAKDKALGKQMSVRDRLTARDFEVIYAILSKPTKDWPLSLPFFSQLNLMNAANHLERMGFKVSLIHVAQG